jgi:hypothetical protein
LFQGRVRVTEPSSGNNVRDACTMLAYNYVLSEGYDVTVNFQCYVVMTHVITGSFLHKFIALSSRNIQVFRKSCAKFKCPHPPKNNNSASWDLQMGFNWRLKG